MLRVRRCICTSLLLTFVFARGIAAQEALSEEDVTLFEEDAYPVLEENCFKCHGRGDEIEGGLTLTSLASMLRGGNQGPAVNREDPASSRLLEMISYQDEEHQMPPDGKLLAWDKDALTEWVLRGAPWPGANLDGPDAEEPLLHGMQITDPELWAFRPVEPQPVPQVRDEAWAQNPIDSYIYARLQEEGLSPGPPAPMPALVRRVYYDLTGLPPTPAETKAFVEDDSPDAYEKVVDRLLASPRYGEKWGRHWLDLVHYADSNGYERDTDKPYMWRYRDYVIDAFNQDKPYDRFIVEQLAGDELDEPTRESLTATGYYRLGLWDDEPADPLLARYDNLDDMVDTTGKVFLGLTLGCARCHSHKFDPITQEDYYSFVAFMGGVRMMKRTPGNGILRSIMTRDEQREYDAQVAEKETRIAELRDDLREILTSFKVRASKKHRKLVEGKALQLPDLSGLRFRFYRDTWTELPDFDAVKPEETGRIDHNFITTSPASRNEAIGLVFEGKLRVPSTGEYTFSFDVRDGVRLVVDKETVFEAVGVGMHKGDVSVELRKGSRPIRLEYFTADGPPLLRLAWSGPGMDRRPLSVQASKTADSDALRKLFLQHGNTVLGEGAITEFAGLSKELRETEKLEVPGKWAATVGEDGPEPAEMHILIRGNPHVPGKAVSPAFPSVFREAEPPLESPYRGEDTSGRRRLLAEWIADPANPLTARVMMNRVWQFHFGRGIVSSGNNFGAQGRPPTHPELLDWLAGEFVRNGWRLKHMHRQMLMSKTYRMSSESRPDALAKDPANRLMWRFNMRRLTAEEVRDSLLQACDTLNTSMYGPGVYPEMPEEAIATSSKLQNIVTEGIWGISSPEDAARRSVYIHVKRSLLMPILTDFDFADTDDSCPERFVTTQPTQALGMLNSAFVNGQADLLARRIRNDAGGDEEAQIRRALEIVTSRPASKSEVDRGMAFIQELVDEDGLDRTRAMEHFCLLAFNLNEFIYLD